MLDIVQRDGLVAKAAVSGRYLQEQTTKAFAQMPIVGEVRGVGMLAAVELVANRDTRERFDPALKVGARISNAARDRGLIARAMPHGDILGFAPPLIMTTGEIDEMIAIAADAAKQVLNELSREGVALS